MGTELSPNGSNDVEGQTIFRFDDGTVFAVARRQELIRCSDGLPWAYMADDRLISVRSGRCLAVRVGSVYYEAESHEPLYYELSAGKA